MLDCMIAAVALRRGAGLAADTDLALVVDVMGIAMEPH